MSWCRKMMGCLSFQIVIIRKNWGNGQMLKRFKGGAENRSGGPEKVRWKEGGEQEILGGIIALRRIVRGEHQKARSLNLSKQWYVFYTGTNFNELLSPTLPGTTNPAKTLVPVEARIIFGAKPSTTAGGIAAQKVVWRKPQFFHGWHMKFPAPQSQRK